MAHREWVCLGCNRRDFKNNGVRSKHWISNQQCYQLHLRKEDEAIEAARAHLAAGAQAQLAPDADPPPQQQEFTDEEQAVAADQGQPHDQPEDPPADDGTLSAAARDNWALISLCQRENLSKATINELLKTIKPPFDPANVSRLHRSLPVGLLVLDALDASRPP